MKHTEQPGIAAYWVRTSGIPGSLLCLSRPARRASLARPILGEVKIAHREDFAGFGADSGWRIALPALPVGPAQLPDLGHVIAVLLAPLRRAHSAPDFASLSILLASSRPRAILSRRDLDI